MLPWSLPMQQHHQQPQQQQQQPQPQPQPPPQNDPPAPTQPITLASVLHYLQTEWRRYERERNEWEIERAEMRARLALLEGERWANDNLKSDLMRRIKMLEYALRQERSKLLSTTADKHHADPKEDSQTVNPSGRTSPSTKNDENHAEKEKPSALPPHIAPLTRVPSSTASLTAPNGLSMAAFEKQSAANQPPPQAQNTMGPGSMGTLGWNRALGKDPKSRARSRDYLKQCLQEVVYLTSPSGLNPLPPTTAAGISRPRKTIPESPPQQLDNLPQQPNEISHDPQTNNHAPVLPAHPPTYDHSISERIMPLQTQPPPVQVQPPAIETHAPVTPPITLIDLPLVSSEPVPPPTKVNGPIEPVTDAAKDLDVESPNPFANLDDASNDEVPAADLDAKEEVPAKDIEIKQEIAVENLPTEGALTGESPTANESDETKEDETRSIV